MLIASNHGRSRADSSPLTILYSVYLPISIFNTSRDHKRRYICVASLSISKRRRIDTLCGHGVSVDFETFFVNV